MDSAKHSFYFCLRWQRLAGKSIFFEPVWTAGDLHRIVPAVRRYLICYVWLFIIWSQIFFSLLLFFYNNTAAQFEACKTLCTLNGKIMTEFHSNFYKVAPHSFWAVNCKHFETEIREIIMWTEKKTISQDIFQYKKIRKNGLIILGNLCTWTVFKFVCLCVCMCWIQQQICVEMRQGHRDTGLYKWSSKAIEIIG